MKHYLEIAICFLVPFLFCMFAFTYIFNAEFGLFIVPEMMADERDNWVRFVQIVAGVVGGSLAVINRRFILK